MSFLRWKGRTRAVRERLAEEEELAVFDLLTQPEPKLSASPREARSVSGRRCGVRTSKPRAAVHSDQVYSASCARPYPSHSGSEDDAVWGSSSSGESLGLGRRSITLACKKSHDVAASLAESRINLGLRIQVLDPEDRAPY